MGVVPFRRPKKKKPRPTPPEVEQEPQRCPECGWKLPADVSADRGAVGRGERLLLYIRCPECGEKLFWPITFD